MVAERTCTILFRNRHSSTHKSEQIEQLSRSLAYGIDGIRSIKYLEGKSLRQTRKVSPRLRLDTLTSNPNTSPRFIPSERESCKSFVVENVAVAEHIEIYLCPLYQ